LERESLGNFEGENDPNGDAKTGDEYPEVEGIFEEEMASAIFSFLDCSLFFSLSLSLSLSLCV